MAKGGYVGGKPAPSVARRLFFLAINSFTCNTLQHGTDELAKSVDTRKNRRAVRNANKRPSGTARGAILARSALANANKKCQGI